MSMIFPQLWNKSSYLTIQETISHLKKYQHLINWKKNASIMEVGFATGYNSSQSLGLFLPSDYKEFIGSDISPNMVEYAKENFKIPRSKITQLDVAGTIPKEFQTRFDHVFGFNVIHLVKNPRKAFKNVYDMLKPGGSAFLTFFERTPVDDMFNRLTRHPKWGKYNQEEMISTYFYEDSPEEAYKLDLKAAGYKNNEFIVEKSSYNYSNEQECYDVCKSVNVTIPRIPKEELEEYLKDYLKELDRSQFFKITFQNGKKCISVDFTYFIVVYTKQ